MGFMLSLCLRFYETADLLSKVAVSFCISISNVQGSSGSASLPTLDVVCLSDDSHPGGCAVILHGGVDLHFPNG